MRDKSGAQRAPTGSGLSIMPAISGGVATPPRAPGHGRPLTAHSSAPRHDRPRATPRAPGADVPLATAAGAPGQHRLRAMANATVSLPAGLRRLRQECLPRVPANPRTLTYPHSQLDTAHNRESGNPRPPVATGGPPGGYAPATRAPPSQTPTRLLSRSTTHQVHPVIQVPPHPRSCSTACTGFLRQHPSRAPPPAHPPKTYPCQPIPPSPHGGEGPGVRPAS